MVRIQLFIFSTFSLVLSAFSQELTPQSMAHLKTVFNEERLIEFLTEYPALKTEKLVLSTYSLATKQDSLNFRLGQSGVREVDNGDGTISYFKVYEATTENIYRLRTIYLDGERLAEDSIQKIQSSILERLGKGEKFEALYAQYNMNPKLSINEKAWTGVSSLFEPFPSLISLHPFNEPYIVDIPYKKMYLIAENIEGPKEQLTKKYLKVTVSKTK